MFSDHKINWSKSTALNISLNGHTISQLRRNFSLSCAASFLKYLWIHISADSLRAFNLNFIPLLATFRQDLLKWDKKDSQFSWIGRINILKMNVLPRLLCLFQVVPTILPWSFFLMLNKMISLFVWAQKKPRIAHITLARPKLGGGLAIPDFKAYYVASVATRILYWFHHNKTKLWVQLEELLSDAPLVDLPWLPTVVKQRQSTLPWVTNITLQASRISPISALFTPDGPMIPLTGNPDLSIRSLLQSDSALHPDKPLILHFLLSSNSLKSLEELVPSPARSTLVQFQYL